MVAWPSSMFTVCFERYRMPKESLSVTWAMAPRWKPVERSLPVSWTLAKSVP